MKVGYLHFRLPIPTDVNLLAAWLQRFPRLPDHSYRDFVLALVSEFLDSYSLSPQRIVQLTDEQHGLRIVTMNTERSYAALAQQPFRLPHSLGRVCDKRIRARPRHQGAV